MGELIHISKHRRKKTVEQIDELPEPIDERELGANVIKLVIKIDETLGDDDEPA